MSVSTQMDGAAVPPICAGPHSGTELRRLLLDSGYTEAAICAALGVSSLRAALAEGATAVAHRTGADGPLAVLVRLFLLDLPVARRDARRAFGATGAALLESCGLVSCEAGSLRATAGLTPVGDTIVAHDRRERHAAHAADFVLGPGPATQNLWALSVRRVSGQILDLGCGSGAIACLAAAEGATVLGTDVSPRALRFARFNSAVNGVNDVCFLEGDLFSPCGGRRFDQILCNPPYVVSPAATYTYRDAAPGICARIVQQAPAFLNDGGIAQVVCNWPQRRGRDWEDEVRAWSEASGCDTWILTGAPMDPVTYAATWLGQQGDERGTYEREFRAWQDFYAREGIEAIGQGLVVLQAVSGRSPWVEVRRAPPVLGPAGDSIVAVLGARDLVSRAIGEGAVHELVFVPAPGLELHERSAMGEPGWVPGERRLCLTSGYGFAARVDALGAGLVGYLDGRRTAREAARAFAAATGVPVAPLLDGLAKLLRDLAWLGLVRPTRAHLHGDGRRASS